MSINTHVRTLAAVAADLNDNGPITGIPDWRDGSPRGIFASVRIPPAPCGAWDCTGCQSVQHNEVNELLANFRMIDDGRGGYADWLPALDVTVGYKPEHISHAHRVLSRLANLTKGENA